MKKQDPIEQQRQELIEKVKTMNEEQTDRVLTMLLENGLLDQSDSEGRRRA